MFSLSELQSAEQLVRRYLPPTPQLNWPLLSARTGADLWVKHENHAPTGAFKGRGGLLHLSKLQAAGQSKRGIISATRGNHGLSLAYAGRIFGLPVTIVVPNANSVEKNRFICALGARLVEIGDDFDAARLEAMRLAKEEQLHFVPSFHPDLVLGVSTWAFELFTSVQDIEALYVPIGLGSGICGAICVRDLLNLRTEIIGVQSAHFPAYATSLAAGKAIDVSGGQTYLDGVSVRIPDPSAFAIIQGGVSRIVTISDDEAAQAVRAYWTDTHNLAEGAGAAALAGVLKERQFVAGRRIAAVLSGGNIDFDMFHEWIGRVDDFCS